MLLMSSSLLGILLKQHMSKWFDKKIVNVVSTFAKSRPLTFVSRYDYKQGRKVGVQCPSIIKLYNSSMGGVDLADCLIELYRINIRFKKYYFRLIVHMIDMVIVNSWLLYKRDAFKLKNTSIRNTSFGSFQVENS